MLQQRLKKTWSIWLPINKLERLVQPEVQVEGLAIEVMQKGRKAIVEEVTIALIHLKEMGTYL